MEVGARNVKVIFEQSRRLVVPLFQRPYVWNLEDQWEPLWHDIEALSNRLIEGKDVRPHFLGAVVLDHVRKPTGHIETRTIIDGQQRLTTLQLFLEAFYDHCMARGDKRHADALRKLTRNDDPLSDDTDDDFKIWPTNVDRDHFRSVMEADSPSTLLKSFDKKGSAKTTGRRIADAYIYFHQAIETWVSTESADETKRIDILYQTIREHLQMVVIDLGRDDDAQMIFETLNARGTPLLPSDLVKNFLFHEILVSKQNLESLYAKHWRQFDEDDDYWRAQTGRGHAKRVRIDRFLQHFLTLKKQDEIEVGHLFAAYREFVRDGKADARQQLADLHSYATIFRSFDRFRAESREGRFFYRISAMDVGTAYPFLLELFQKFGAEEEAIQQTLVWLESFLVRRMICQLNTRGYNRLFIDLLQTLKGTATNLPNRVRDFLRASDAESNRWPSDTEFRSAWRDTPIYGVLVRERVRMVLEALEMQLRTAKSEKVTLQEKLTIEHVLPQSWVQHWPLPEGQDSDEAAEHRNRVLHTMGNLTLVTKKLNPAISNGPWKKKRPEIRRHSVLRLNLDLVDCDEWNEETIRSRSGELFDIARKLWPYPK